MINKEVAHALYEVNLFHSPFPIFSLLKPDSQTIEKQS